MVFFFDHKKEKASKAHIKYEEMLLGKNKYGVFYYVIYAYILLINDLFGLCQSCL